MGELGRLALFAGQLAGQVRSVQPAAKIVHRMERKAAETIRSLSETTRGEP